jgi:lysophospholipase L1-like esterase
MYRLLLFFLLLPLPLASAQTPEPDSAVVTTATDLQTLQNLLHQPHQLTWVFTGDSITHGALWTNGARSWSELVSERLRWEMRRTRDLVINTAISGNRADDILTDFDWRVAHLHPDVVTLMIGMNDCSAGPAGQKHFAANLEELVTRIRALGAIPILATTNTTLKDPNRTDLPAYNAIVRSVATRQNVILVDNWAYWQHNRNAANLSLWLGNPIHPNACGHIELAQEFLRKLDLLDPKSPTSTLPTTAGCETHY